MKFGSFYNCRISLVHRGLSMATKIQPKAQLPRTCFCVRDGREYSSERFYAHKNTEVYPKGYIPYCKDCCEDIVKFYLKKCGTLESAMWYTCAFFDLPFIKKVFDNMVTFKNTFQAKSGKEDAEYSIFAYYYDYLWGSKSSKKALEEWNTFADSDVDFKDIQGLTKSDENIRQQIEKLELDWGLQESEEDYRFLEYMYDKYTKDINIENPQQEDLYRDLCLARLEKRKAEQGKIDTDITKIQARILTLMNKLKLDEFESTKPKSLSEQLMFAKIAQIEMLKPADLYKEPTKYKDFNKVKKYYQDICLRALRNTLAGTRDFDIDMEHLSDYNLETEE